MIPKSLSASSLQVAESCLARYKAEHIDRAAGFSGGAANVGIVCHGTLEQFVKRYAIIKEIGWDSIAFWDHFHEAYDEVFGADRTKPEYEDARRLCYDWFNREDQKDKIDACKVLSVESKSNFPLANPVTSDIPVNYIMDRLDQLGPDEFRIVDYKSQRAPLTPAQMRKKIQPRLYALAIQIKFPEAKTIWVEYDFLRHYPVAVEFTKEDNTETYRMIRRSLRKILETPDDEAPETLNPDCGWCVRKASCKALMSNTAAGGITGLSIDQLAILHMKAKAQLGAVGYLLANVEEILLNHAVNLDVLEWETDNTLIKVSSQARRKPDQKKIRELLGPDLLIENSNVRVSDVDRLIKEKRVDAETAALLKKAMPAEIGELGIKVELL